MFCRNYRGDLGIADDEWLAVASLEPHQSGASSGSQASTGNIAVVGWALALQVPSSLDDEQFYHESELAFCDPDGPWRRCNSLLVSPTGEAYQCLTRSLKRTAGGEGEVEMRLAQRIVLRLEKTLRLHFVMRFEAGLLPGGFESCSAYRADREVT